MTSQIVSAPSHEIKYSSYFSVYVIQILLLSG